MLLLPALPLCPTLYPSTKFLPLKLDKVVFHCLRPRAKRDKTVSCFRGDSHFVKAGPSESRKGRIYGFVKRGSFCLQPGTKYVRKSDNIEPKSLPQANISERKERGGALQDLWLRPGKSRLHVCPGTNSSALSFLTKVPNTYAQALCVISGVCGSQKTCPALDAPKQIESYKR